MHLSPSPDMGSNFPGLPPPGPARPASQLAQPGQPSQPARASQPGPASQAGQLASQDCWHNRCLGCRHNRCLACRHNTCLACGQSRFLAEGSDPHLGMFVEKNRKTWFSPRGSVWSFEGWVLLRISLGLAVRTCWSDLEKFPKSASGEIWGRHFGSGTFLV